MLCSRTQAILKPPFSRLASGAASDADSPPASRSESCSTCRVDPGNPQVDDGAGASTARPRRPLGRSGGGPVPRAASPASKPAGPNRPNILPCAQGTAFNSRYVLRGVLGRGCSACVFYCESRGGGSQTACKLARYQPRMLWASSSMKVPSWWPEQSAPAARGWLFRLLAAPRTRDEPLRRSGPNGRLRCRREALPKSPILRLSSTQVEQDRLHL